MQLTFPFGNATIEFQVVFRKRRSITIMVEPPDKVTVIVPIRTRQEVILEKVKLKAPWIMRKLDYFKNNQHQYINRGFVDGELFLYLGRDYQLHLEMTSLSKKPQIELNSRKLWVKTPTKDEEQLKKAIEGWYRQRAREVILARIKCYQRQIMKEPNRVVIKEQKKRWGSCSSKGNLNFNWKIVMAPLAILDYIVVHELCHLVYFNHSLEFWNMVATVLPDYKIRKEWLKKNGARMSL